MTARTLILAAAVTAITSIPVLAQESAPSPQPGTAPPARGSAPASGQPRIIPPPAGAPRVTAQPTEPPRIVAPPAAPAPERPRREGQPINIKVDLTLTDQRGGAETIKRTVTVLTADGYTGSIRTMSLLSDNPGTLNVPLNVDASPTLIADGKIRVAINLQYDWPSPENRTRGQVLNTSLHDQLMVILDNGKAMIVAQSADPVGDRQVTMEVKATVLK